jgi:hypothetical protein
MAQFLEIWKTRSNISAQNSYERAMGIEPTSEAWEALNKTLKAIELAALNCSQEALIGKLMENELRGHPASTPTLMTFGS